MTNGNEPAHPLSYESRIACNYPKDYAQGLTKREHLAGLAMQGILANHSFDPFGNLMPIGELAAACADALIAALNTKQQ